MYSAARRINAKRPTLPLCFAFTTALLANGPDAGAAPLPPPGPRIDLCSQEPALSPDGTSGSCADPEYIAKCSDAQRDACKTLFDKAFRSFIAGTSTSKKVILPPSMPHPSGTPGTLYDAAVLSDGKLLGSAGTLGPTFESTLRMNPSTALILDWYDRFGPTYAYRTPLFNEELAHVDVNDPWRDSDTVRDANRISECAEYVYKRWWAFSWFDQVAHLPGVDTDMLSALAVVPSSYGTLQRAMKRADGLSISPALPFLPSGSNIPRNIFFAINPSWLDTTDPDQAAVKGALDGRIGEQLVVSGSDRHELDWAYRQHLNLGPIADAKRRDNERRMNAYAERLVHWADLQHGYYHARLARKCLDGYKQACNAWADEGGEVYLGSGFDKRPFRATAEMRDAAVAYYTTTVESTKSLPSIFGPKYYTGPMPSQPKSYYDDAMASLQAAELAVQKDLTQALVDEWKYDATHGCLQTLVSGSETQANSCDFLPQNIAARYVGLFQKERQEAYDRCIRNTGNDFSVMQSPGLDVFLDPAIRKESCATSPSCRAKDYTIGLVAVDKYLDLYDVRDKLNREYEMEMTKKYQQNLRTYTTALPTMAGDLTAPMSIGEEKEDRHEEGGDWFGGGYSYGYKWHIVPKSQDPSDVGSPICSLSGDIGGHFEAHAKILKLPLDIVDAAFVVSSAPGRAKLDAAHFSFLGKSYFNADGKEFTGASFDQPIDYTPGDWGAAVPIPIGPFVLEVGAGASLHVGANMHAAVVPPPACDPNNLTWSMNASIAPEITAKAKAWVAVNLIVASAGVEGEIDLLKAQLPLSADVRLESDASGIALRVKADARLKLTELSGRVNAYVSGPFGIGHASFELFSWDGFHQDLGLWHHDGKYPLDALNYRIFGHWDHSKVLPTT